MQRWTSLLGCLEGCLRYLGRELEPAWLFGATGQAFVLNISEKSICPSAWDTSGLLDLGKKLGFKVDGLLATIRQPDFNAVRAEACQRALEAGKPCIVWEMKIPEYYVVNG